MALGIIKPYLKTVIDKATVARLATVDSECKPHLVPVVFVFDNDYYFIPIDEKTKRSRPENLKRVKNIQQNPNVALLIDEYNEDWRKLYFIMIQGKASIMGGKEIVNKMNRYYYKKHTKCSIIGGKETEQNEQVLLQKAHKMLDNRR